MGYTLSAACCPLCVSVCQFIHYKSVVCECVSNNRRDASTAVHARRMPQTKYNNIKIENGIQQRPVQQKELHHRCLLLFTAATAVLLLLHTADKSGTL